MGMGMGGGGGLRMSAESYVVRQSTDSEAPTAAEEDKEKVLRPSLGPAAFSGVAPFPPGASARSFCATSRQCSPKPRQ